MRLLQEEKTECFSYLEIAPSSRDEEIGGGGGGAGEDGERESLLWDDYGA